MTGMYPTLSQPHWGAFVASQAQSLRSAGIQVDLVYPRTGPAPFRYLVGALAVLTGTLVKRYDVVHAHFGLWGWAARMQVRAPVVISFCGDDLLGRPDGHGGTTFRSRIVVLASRLLARCVDAVIVKSDEMAATLPGVACHVIPNGVDFARFKPGDQGAARDTLGLSTGTTYALFVADPQEVRKRFDLAAAAVARAAPRVPGGMELLVVRGQTADVVAGYLQAADILILTSEWEGSPNVVKEAMATNLPVVSVRVGDVPRLIGSTAGCYLAAHDVEDLAQKLAEAVAGCSRTAGRADIAHLQLDAVAQRVAKVYEEVQPRWKPALGREAAGSQV